MTAAVMADTALHGRTRITARAVRRVVSAVTAEALRVAPSDVSVRLDDEDGSLVVVAESSIHLDRDSVAGRGSVSLLDRLSTAQTSIQERTLELTGSTVRRVDLRITDADLTERRRVS